MLAKSSKSRLAAMALMALGVSTFMGSSVALADVSVTGAVGDCTALSSVTASPVAFGSVVMGTTGSKSLTPSLTQGKKADCSARNSSVTASLGGFSTNASATTSGSKVVITIGSLSGGAFPMTAIVPSTATPAEAFSATVTLTLTDNT